MDAFDQFHGGPTPKRVLLYDLENTSIQIEAWRTYDTDAIRVTREWYILSIAWKWLGEKQTHVLALDDFKTFKKNHRDDKELIKAFYPVFDSADIVVAHNGNYHDQRKLKARFIYHGLNPPSPYQQIDTYIMAKRQFAFTSNKLDELGRYLGVGRKEKIYPDHWEGCMQGDLKAFKKMKHYNKQDVLLLERVYLKLRAWAPNHPYIGVSGPHRKKFSEMDDMVCPRCGSGKLSSQGWRETNASRFRRYQCLDCGGYCSSTNRVAKKKGLKAQ